MVKAKCRECKKLLVVGRNGRRNKYYCSRECQSAYEIRSGTKKKPPLTRECEQCGKAFEIRRVGGRRNQRFCSRACSSLNRRTNIESACERCGKTFRRPPSARLRFCSVDCAQRTWSETTRYEYDDQRRASIPRGPAAGAWKRGRRVAGAGYITRYCPEHTRAKKHYVMEHVLVAEAILCRPLIEGETVHHIDEAKGNNDPDNLYLFPTGAAHRSYHTKLRYGTVDRIVQSNLAYKLSVRRPVDP